MAKVMNSRQKETRIQMASSAVVLMGALFANHAFAQQEAAVNNVSESVVEAEETQTTSDNAADSGDDVEEIVVYGIKQSLQTAQDLKRDSATVIDAVTASDIMSLPDKSVVDALTRVPGVTVEVFEATNDPEHFSAEGSSALVRGLNRTLTQFNGRTSFSATQWGALNLSHIPAELVGAIEVQKNQTASMIEGGIAGTLNLVTRKPFDNAEQQLGGSIKVDYADEAEEWSPNISGLYSNSWETDAGDFGFLISLAYSDTDSSSSAVGAHNFYERSERDGGAGTDHIGPPLEGAEDGAVYWMPPAFQIRKKDDTRDRTGLVTSVQWRNPDDDILATLEFIRSDGHSVWTERLVQYKDSLGNNQSSPEAADLMEIPGLSGINESFNDSGVFTHGVLSGGNSHGFAPETRYHDEETYVNDLSLDVEWAVNENLTLDGSIHYVDSGQDMFDNTIHSFFESDMWLDLRDSESPQVGFLGTNFRQLTPAEAAARDGSLFVDSNGNYWGGNTSAVADPNVVVTRSAMEHQTESRGDALAFAVDADYEFDEGWITNVKTGFRVSTREQVHKSTEYDWGVISPDWSDEHARRLADYPDYQFQELVDFGSGFHDGDAFVDGSATEFWLPKIEWVRDLAAFEAEYKSIVPLNADEDPTWYYSLEDNPATDPFVALVNQVVDGKAPGSPFAPLYIFEIKEKNTAAYVQVDFAIEDGPVPIRGNVGFRYVDIDVTTSGSRIFDLPSGLWVDPEVYDSGTEINLPDDLAQWVQANAAEYQRAEAAGETPNYAGPEGLDWLNGFGERVDVKPEKYSTVLPSLNLVANLTDELLFRFAASKALYVPHLSLKRAGQTLGADISTVRRPDDQLPTGSPEGLVLLDSVNFNGYTSSTIGGSNPYLVPEESINTDIGLEWYFSDVGSVTGVLFSKDMKNLIRKATTDLETENPQSGAVETVTQADTYNNVGDARINGIELSYQQTLDMLPAPWNGLGIQANYTYLDTKEVVGDEYDNETYGAYTNLPLEALSPRNYNFIVFYENDKFNSRLAYNYRSRYMLNSRDVIGKLPVYNEERGVLDFSFTYYLFDGINVGFDVNNITDEQTRTLYQYTEGGALAPRNYFVNDRRFTFRISGSF